MSIHSTLLPTAAFPDNVSEPGDSTPFTPVAASSDRNNLMSGASCGGNVEVTLLGKEYIICLAPDELTRVVLIQRRKRLWRIASDHAAAMVLSGIETKVLA